MGAAKRTAILVGMVGLLGAIGAWLLVKANPQKIGTEGTSSSLNGSESLPPPTQPMATQTFPEPQQVPPGTTIALDGDSNVAPLNNTLKTQFQKTYPGTLVRIQTAGKDQSILNVNAGKVDMAASDRLLTPQEQAQGLVALPVAGLNIPDAPTQPRIYYIYKNPPSPAVQAFLGFATSPTGQQAIAHLDPAN